MYLLYIIPLSFTHTHTYDLDVLTHLRTILLLVLQIGKEEIGKAEDLSAPLHISY
jgi:hypothetical protein